MREMTLHEIQSVNLELMKDIHSFCVEHGIHYSLAYGSLIGAIRHNGFIPWDDDIDIMMPRPDFERFSAEYKSKNGYYLSSVYDDDTYINYTRVYDNRTVVISPGVASTHDIGVWIDIYPIDGISDNKEISENQFQRLRHYTGLVLKWRKNKRKVEKSGLINGFKYLLNLTKLRFSGDIISWHNKICDICKENNFGETKRCSSLVCYEANKRNKQEIFLTEHFENFILHSFEDQEFYVASGYDAILKTIFGNYMEIPPKEKQISHILGKWQFYWKAK